MSCNTCKDYKKGEGCTSVMEDVCDGRNYYIPTFGHSLYKLFLILIAAGAWFGIIRWLLTKEV